MPAMPAMHAKPTPQADGYSTPAHSSQPTLEPERLIDANPTPPESSLTIEPEGAPDMHHHPTERLDGVEYYEYRDIRPSKEAVDTQAKAFGSPKADESPSLYLIFPP
ncbi:hypothetical protein B9Z19DRAFT_1067835 [Tuber borchii]|uniref:Uncharacterized protein n=1 Tax=Tuber borchii TaxID=42251 RepID=A0A2T6ZHG7_TUBBO|nr:hypothetical protein B9Z19DRAFT_1067835 [Tuber borchii]